MYPVAPPGDQAVLATPRLGADGADESDVAAPHERAPSLESAMRVSATREAMPSLRKMWRGGKSTVCRDKNTRVATCWFDRPSATRAATDCSVSVRLSQPQTGRCCRLQ